MSVVMRRVLTAVVLLAGFIPALFFAPMAVWSALAALVMAVAAHEWARLARFPHGLAVVYAVLLGLIALGLPYLPDSAPLAVRNGLLALAAVFWVFVAPVWLGLRWRADAAFVRAAVGAVILLAMWAALLDLRERGPWVLLAVMAVVWIADTAAFFAGRRFGQHKLAPRISPGKTREGVIGAMLALILYASAVSAAVVGLRIVGALLLTMALLYFSVLGDLFESWIKRVAEIKDSGSLLPGHGGVLDRIDALTSALPIAAGVLLIASHYQ
jgi:phosphatidate cytidylyltransferase